MRIGILTCLWGRFDIFEIFAAGITRLSKEFDIVTICVGSEGERSRELCEKHNIKYLGFPNRPLSNKFNAGMEAIQIFSPDYVMVLGSDDLISTPTMQRVYSLCEKGYDVIGFTDVWFYDTIKKQLLYWPGFGYRGDKADALRKGECIGLGRTLSKNLLYKLNWNPWKSGVDKGLDWWMTQKIKKLNITPRTINLRSENLFAVDIKTKDNICSADLYKTIPCGLDDLNIEEAEQIKVL